MQKLMTLALCLTLGALTVACGDSGGPAGSYKLDTSNLLDGAMEKAAADMKKKAADLSPAERNLVEEKFKEMADNLQMTAVLNDDNTFEVTGSMMGEKMSAKGTWKLEGEKLHISTTESDGKKKDKPEEQVFTLKGDVIEMPGPAGMKLQLKKQ